MSQTADIWNDMIQGYMLGAAISTAGTMMLELIFATISQEKERLKETLKHEPTQEDWEDYWQFLGERIANPKCIQRSEDREKIRLLIFGANSENTKIV